MNEVEKAKREDQFEKELDEINFKEVYNKLIKAQKLKTKHFQLVQKQELIVKLQETVKGATTLLYNLENGLNEYEPDISIDKFYKHMKTEYFEDWSLKNDFNAFKRTHTVIDNIYNLTLFQFRRVFDTNFLTKELQKTIQHLTTLLLKLESGIDE